VWRTFSKWARASALSGQRGIPSGETWGIPRRRRAARARRLAAAANWPGRLRKCDAAEVLYRRRYRRPVQRLVRAWTGCLVVPGWQVCRLMVGDPGIANQPLPLQPFPTGADHARPFNVNVKSPSSKVAHARSAAGFAGKTSSRVMDRKPARKHHAPPPRQEQPKVMVVDSIQNESLPSNCKIGRQVGD